MGCEMGDVGIQGWPWDSILAGMFWISFIDGSIIFHTFVSDV